MSSLNSPRPTSALPNPVWPRHGQALATFAAASWLAVSLYATPLFAQPAADPSADPATPAGETLPDADAAPITTAPARPAHVAWLEQLDHPAWAVREEATEALLSDTTTDLRTLIAAAQALPESLERALRLDRVLRHRLIAQLIDEATEPGDPASLGITHPSHHLDALPQHEGVEIAVMDTLPGFPSYVALRPGDVIVSLNGQPIPPAPPDAPPDAAPPIKPMLEKLRAGDTVPIGIYRDGRPLELAVTLASSNVFLRVYTPTTPTGLRPEAAQRFGEALDALRRDTTPPAQPEPPAGAEQPSPSGQPAPPAAPPAD